MNMQAPVSFLPPPPHSLAECGVSLVMMRDILIKTMYRAALSQATDIARVICLPLPVTQELIDHARRQGLVEATGTLHAGASSEMAYQLSDTGRARAQDALSQSEYYGAIPVPLAEFKAQVRRQSVRDIRVTRDRLVSAMGDMVLPRGLIDQLGPAISSGRSVLMYGPPGNGKSSIANGIRNAIGDRVFVPRAIEYGGQVITVYDPVVHSRAAGAEDDPKALRRSSSRFDNRYVLCDRPTVITGGELSLSMLDLVYNPVARTYQAPLQLKATGGVFIIDDLGRQAEPPQTIINRWIVPLEEGHDILSLQSGEKFLVPFDTLLIFSTNFHPTEIFDQAALRRIFFKIRIDGPDQEAFLKIFALVARRKGMPLDEASVIHLLNEKYPAIGNNFANYQAGFLIDQLLAICAFEGKPPQMTPAMIDRAWENLFVRAGHVVR